MEKKDHVHIRLPLIINLVLPSRSQLISETVLQLMIEHT